VKLSHIRKVYLASPRGFCAGVARAVDIVDILLKKFGAPLYVRHAIVHNKHVVKEFIKRGAIFVENFDKVPHGARVVFSAHGSPPSLLRQAIAKGLKVYDAVCPLVTKVHIEAKRYVKDGYFIFYIGHKDHPEPVGVMGEVPEESIVLIESLEDAEEVVPPQTEKLIVLSQTTLSMDDTKKIIQKLEERFPSLKKPPAMDICYATQNRQEAVRDLVKHVDFVLVVGSKTSSNSNRLRDLSEEMGVPAKLVNDETEIEESWFQDIKHIGVTAGASAPEHIIQGLINYLRKDGAEVEELQTIHEKIFFPLPNLDVAKA
jgi:4-hydroxy-3-methylbut-2-enyl diphosphate reductase